MRVGIRVEDGVEDGAENGVEDGVEDGLKMMLGWGRHKRARLAPRLTKSRVRFGVRGSGFGVWSSGLGGSGVQGSNRPPFGTKPQNSRHTPRLLRSKKVVNSTMHVGVRRTARED